MEKIQIEYKKTVEKDHIRIDVSGLVNQEMKYNYSFRFLKDDLMYQGANLKQAKRTSREKIKEIHHRVIDAILDVHSDLFDIV